MQQTLIAVLKDGPVRWGTCLGVSLKDISFSNDGHNYECSYIVDCRSCVLYTISRPRGGNVRLRAFDGMGDQSLAPGSLVHVRLDCDAHTVTFGLNGVWDAAPSFVDLEAGATWFPYVEMFGSGQHRAVTRVNPPQ